jgi:hypothetical protein
MHAACYVMVIWVLNAAQEKAMKRKLASAALGLIIGVLAAVPANAWDRGKAEVFADLPAPAEGLAVGPANLPGGEAGFVFAASNTDNNPGLFVIPPAGCGGPHLPKCTAIPITPRCISNEGLPPPRPPTKPKPGSGCILCNRQPARGGVHGHQPLVGC